MCMFLGEVTKVAKTQLIYATLAHSLSGQRFALQVYVNEVALNKDNQPVMMILPVPIKSANAQSILLLNKKGDRTAEDLLRVLREAMKPPPQPEARSYGFGGSLSARGYLPLPVVQSGSYDVSIVPTCEHLFALDPSVFAFNDEELVKTLKSSYGGGEFCFLACKLRASADNTPFAYMYPQEEGRPCFIPTKHYHRQGSAEQMQIDSTITVDASADSMKEVALDWDHEIYIVNPQEGGFSSSNPATRKATAKSMGELGPLTCSLVADKVNKLVALHADSIQGLMIVPSAHLAKLSIQGRFENIDIIWSEKHADGPVYMATNAQSINAAAELQNTIRKLREENKKLRLALQAIHAANISYGTALSNAMRPLDSLLHTSSSSTFGGAPRSIEPTSGGGFTFKQTDNNAQFLDFL